MSNIHVGDLVIGNNRCEYTCTNKKTLCLVISEGRETYNDISVDIVSGEEAGMRFDVSSNYFDVITVEEYREKFPATEISANLDDLMKKYPRRFHIGDYVTGRPEAPYGLTNSNALMVVQSLEDFVLGIVASDNMCHKYEEYDVNEDFFVLTTPKKWLAEHPDARIFVDELLELSEQNRPEPVQTCMDTSLDYVISPEQERRMKDEMIDLLTTYDYPTGYGVDKIFTEVYGYGDGNGTHHPGKKSWILALLSRHKNWNPETLSVEFPAQKWKRGVEKDKVSNFMSWCKRQLTKFAVAGTMDSEQFGTAQDFVNILYTAIEKEVDEAAYIDHHMMKEMNKLYPNLGVHENQKINRVFKRWGKIVGLDTIREMRPVTHNNITTEKDYGWNYQYSNNLCDGLSPLEYERDTKISLNWVDYLTMSFGDTWASCHTIDKEGKYHEGGGHSYSGCYSSGTLSYLLDGSSIIMWTVPKNPVFEGPNRWDKERRCMFFLGEDKVIQSRVYPDGRDCPDDTIKTQFRNIMQLVVSTCLGIPNAWDVKSGSCICREVTESYGTHYRDYTEYNDGTVSFVRHDNGYKNKKVIKIGARPICPCCGDRHDREEYITCEDCFMEGKVRCYRCGAILNEDDAVYDEDTGRYFCDGYCAEDYDCFYCENVGEWHSENVYTNSLDRYFYGEALDAIHTEDGEVFENEHDADAADYHNVNGEWWHEGDLEYCDRCEEWVLRDDYDYEHDCCIHCLTESEVA